MKRALGLIQDKGYHERKPFKALKAKLKATPKGQADLSIHTPPIFDQNNVGACVIHTLAAGVVTTLAAKGKPLGFIPSQRDGYSMSLAADRARDLPMVASVDFPPLQDKGTQLLTGVTQFSKWGVVPMGPKVKLYGAEYMSDCGPGNYADEVDIQTFIKASRKLIVGPYEMLPNSYDFETEVQLSLDAGHSVALGGYIDTLTFTTYRDGSNPIGRQNPHDPEGGGHATLIIGYITLPSGQVLYRLRNSWGTVWGQKGEAWVTGEFLNQMWEAYALDVEVLS